MRNLGPATKFVDEIFQPEESNSLDAHKNLINKKRCMTILLHKYFSGERIRSSYLIKTKTYILKTDALDAFKLLSKQREPSNDLIATMKEMSSVFDNISIGNLVLFLQSLLNEEKQIMDEFNQIKSDFNTIDTQDTYARLWDKVRGCLDLCPCCKRPCDFDHTQIKSRPGSQYNEHRCTSGHALRAMNGYKFEVTDEASLLMCEQITDDQIIVVDSKRYKWSEFKSHHSNWNFESALGDNELNKLHGKFLTVWGKVGRELCKKHNMKYVTYNTTPGIIHESFHYILLLDGSSSMRGQRWEDLLKAVQEFLTRRRELNTQDHVTIIVFSRAAKIKYFDYEIDKVDLTTIESSGGRTNFGAAFKCVNDCIDRPKKDTSSNTNNHYAIIFMSDGEAPYPEQELNQLLHAHDSVIKRFWTVSLGDPNSVAAQILEKINEKMNGSFYDIEASNDLINAYAEIASSSTSNNGSI